MKHVSQVNIASYRGLSNIEIGGLSDVNVFLGPSNSGKTSALEAIHLASNPFDVDKALQTIVRGRGLAGHESTLSLFPHLDATRVLDVALSLAGGVDHTRVQLNTSKQKRPTLLAKVHQQEFDPDDYYFLDADINAEFDGEHSGYTFQCALDTWKTPIDTHSQFDVRREDFPLDHSLRSEYVSPADLTEISVFDDRYSAAFLLGTLPDLLSSLRSVYPLLKDIRPVKSAPAPSKSRQTVDRWMSYVQLSDGVYPMFVMGDGFKAAMVLLSHALSPGLLLLDTPEAFQHVGGLEVLSKSIAEAAGGLDSQVMIATQSLEFLDILLRDCQEREVNVSVTRFEHKNEGIVTYRPLSGRSACDARDLIGLDLRR